MRQTKIRKGLTEAALGQESTSIVASILFSIQRPSHIHHSGGEGALGSMEAGDVGVGSGDRNFLLAGGIITTESDQLN